MELLKVVDDYPDAYPKVLSFKGDCPLEDSGGRFGYEELAARILFPSARIEHEMKLTFPLHINPRLL